MSESVDEPLRRLRREAHAPDQTGTAGLRLLASRPKTGPFAPEAAFNSDLAFEDGYAYQGNYEGVTIWDVRDPSQPDAGQPDRLPGLAERRHDQRRHPDHLDRLAAHQRQLQQHRADPTPASRIRPTLGGPEGLRRPRSDGSPRCSPACATDCGSHTHTVLPEAEPPARLRPVVRHRAPAATRCDTGATGARQDLGRRGPEGEPGAPRRSSASRSCSRTAATAVTTRHAARQRPPAATTSPSTRRSASRPAPAPARARSSTSRTRSTRR